MSALLEVRGLSKHFGGLRAVEALSFDVHEGEILGLIGPNGAGKTTSFNLIAGFLKPDRGSVMFAGAELAGRKSYAICLQGVARTFQVARPFGSMTVLGNVTTGALARHTSVAVAGRHAVELLDLVGLSDKAHALARDLTTIDQRRLEVARALGTQPRLLLLDETMAGLSPTEVDLAVGLVRSLRQRGLTLIVVEHVMRAMLALADRIVVMDHGQKITEDTPAAALSDPRVIEAYLGRRADHAS